MANTEKSPIERLPVELQQALMSFIPDLSSLRSTVLSSPLLYNAFMPAETHVTRAVLFNQLDSSLLPEAIAARESSRLAVYDRESNGNFAAKYLARRSSPNSWTLADALPIGRLHVFVHYFAERFAATILARKPSLTAQSLPRPTRSEVHRFERALYRFEIYCNLFRSYSSPGEDERRGLYFSYFSPYENEQLGCIHDLLIRVIAPAFNDVAEHDISWGAFKISYIDNVHSAEGEHLLSCGLESLYHIAQARTYGARHKLLHRGDDRNDEPLQREFFLYRDLWWIASPEFDGFETLSELTPQEKDVYIKHPFFDDPDPGPARIWWWAHQDETPAAIVGVLSREPYRRWGYVLWDISRLESIGILKNPCDEPEVLEDEFDEFCQEDRRRSLERSWKEREKIWRAGGTGWWSFFDQSKVAWPPRTKRVPLYIAQSSAKERRG